MRLEKCIPDVLIVVLKHIVLRLGCNPNGTEFIIR